MKEMIIASLFFATLASGLAAGFKEQCSLETAAEGLAVFEHCAEVGTDSNLKINPEIRKKMTFNQSGLAAVFVKGNCYWSTRNGKTMRTHCFDNGSDEFSEGLTRYVSSQGKFGFMNAKLNVVIPAQFDFVFPFENGKARYCNGCTPEKTGEHTSMTGGTWGHIGKTGKRTELKSN